jgi:hypothetical protein
VAEAATTAAQDFFWNLVGFVIEINRAMHLS